MIPCNRCKRERAEIAARVAAKRSRRRAERVEMRRYESEKSAQHAFSGFLQSSSRDAWSSSRGVGNTQGAQRGRQGTHSTAKAKTAYKAPHGGAISLRRWRRAEVTAQGAKRKSARCRR